MSFFKNLFGRPKNKFVDNSNNPLAYKFDQGESCDVISDSYGEFGREATNPIPVNGPKGEILYLNNLRTLENEPLIFHRISYQEVAGLDEAVDIFEVTNVKGTKWDILFLHMYHPRNSNVAPKQLMLSKDNSIFSNLPVGLGITSWSPNFPFGLIKSIDSFYGKIAPVSKTLEKLIVGKSFIRPISHLSKLLNLNSANQFFEKIVIDVSNQYPDNYLINLLKQRDFRLQFLGIKSVINKKTINPELLNALCLSILYHRDKALLDLILNAVVKFDKDAHKALKEINNPLMWDIYLGSNFLELMAETYNSVCLPYLFQTRNNVNCPAELANKIDQIVDEITYRQQSI